MSFARLFLPFPQGNLPIKPCMPFFFLLPFFFVISDQLLLTPQVSAFAPRIVLPVFPPSSDLNGNETLLALLFLSILRLGITWTSCATFVASFHACGCEVIPCFFSC